MTRLLGGDVIVAEVDETKDFGAILLWLPPHKRLGSLDFVTLWRSGLLGMMLPWHYGLTGVYRIEVTFEGKANDMFAEALPNLPPKGFKQEECGYVQMLASNPKYAGKRYASQLLRHQLHQVHFAQYPDRPVILDTSTAQAVRAYEGLGFTLLGQRSVPTDSDERGIRLPAGGAAALSEEARQRIKETCIIRAMARLP
jgi:GNAT superfamily N-acetyltransferase